MAIQQSWLSGPTLLEDGEVHEATIAIEGARIVSVRPGIAPDADIVTSGVIAPGFIDLQLNGGYGHDFTVDPATIAQVAMRLPETGVTGFLPTCITSPIDAYAEWLAAARAAARHANAVNGANVLGVHLEGVYFNPLKKGAHNPDLLRPIDVEEIVERYIATGGDAGFVRIVTLAPELDHGLEAIQILSALGVIVSAGHSNATFSEAQLAIDAGLGWGTHLFNAMHDLKQREPGLAAALLLSDVPVGMIADGVHLHPAVVQMVYRLKGADEVTLVTDAMAAMGMSDGAYQLGGYEVRVDGGTARLANGTLAGSVLTMDGAVRHLLAQSGCTLAEALTMASRTPADLLGLNTKGRIAPGADADIVVLDSELAVTLTLCRGAVAYSRPAN
jgi:N-acetylglucosamine-6-phosphate deacetylase